MTDQHTAAFIRHLASWGLNGGPTAPASLPPDVSADQIADIVQHHRITGVALDALSSNAVTRGVHTSEFDKLVAEISTRHLRLLQQSLMAEADLIRVARCLNGAGIDHRVLKGLATAHLDYPDPALRVTSDADVLVSGDQLGAATIALNELIEWNETMPDRRVAHTERYEKARTLKLRSGGTLDLHRMIAPGYWGMRLNHAHLFEVGVGYRLANTQLTALTPEHRLVHAILHAGFPDEVSLQSLRDVAILVEKLNGQVVQLLESPWLRPVQASLAAGIVRVSASLDFESELEVWLAGAQPSRTERLARRTTDFDGSRSHWSGLLAIPPWEWPRYGSALAFPSNEYLAWYGKRRRDQLASGWKAVTDRARRDV